jgi:hypothetical protein
MSLTERAGPAPDLVAMSKAMMGEGSKSFAQAAALFDRETRAGAYLLYALVPPLRRRHRRPGARPRPGGADR